MRKGKYINVRVTEEKKEEIRAMSAVAYRTMANWLLYCHDIVAKKNKKKT